MQQRGISRAVLDLLRTYGRAVPGYKEGALVYFDKQARSLIRRDTSRREYARLEPKLKAYCIESPDGRVLTVGYRYKSVHT
jgi:hypothetical protein